MRQNRVSKKHRRRLALFKRTKAKHGLPPGTPVHVGDAPDFVPYVTVHEYNASEFKEHKNVDPKRLCDLVKDDKTIWIDVEGVHDIGLIKQVCETFEIHPLTQEDIVNTNLRPQFEAYPGYFFFSLKMLFVNPENRCLTQEHVTILLKDNIVISFQEKPGDVFHILRDRLKGAGRVRSRGADYLTYTLMDAIVDGYYRVIEHVGDQIELLEDDIRANIRSEHLESIYDIKREILFLRKNVFPVRDLINKVQVESAVFRDNSRIYLKDLNDHALQVTESIALFTEAASVLLDTYHSLQNQRMNNIIKVLTMISTVFLPLNFIAGVYGMNFTHMPEIDWPYSYPLVLSAMALIAIGMLVFFVKRRWLWESRGRGPAPRS